ncbi:hypothetical protein BGZ93_001373, partial [Podila epicladia]
THSRVSSTSATQDDKENKYPRRSSVDMRGDYGDVYLENLKKEQEDGDTKNSAGLSPSPANNNTKKPWARSPSRASSPTSPRRPRRTTCRGPFYPLEHEYVED